jgi:hypothetical protein
MKDDPSRAADVEAQVKRSVARSMYEKAKATDAAQAVAKRISDQMHAGKSLEEAIKGAASPTAGRDLKPETLRVLPAAPTASAGADAGPGAGAAAAGDAGAKKAGGKTGAATAEAAAALPVKRFDATTDGDRPQVQTSSAFNRGGDPFPGLSPEGTTSVLAFAFGGGKEGDAMAAPVRTADGFSVVQLKQQKASTREDFTKNREALEQELLRAKRDEALSLYVRRLREQAKSDLKIEEAYVQEAKADGGSGALEDEDEY